MNKYLEAEKRLAELKGWAVVEYQSTYQRLIGLPPAQIERTNVPRWTRDNAAAFALMVEHTVDIVFAKNNDNVVDRVGAWPTGSFPGPQIKFADHPDKETAVRYAIVMAVIAKLEAQRPG